MRSRGPLQKCAHNFVRVDVLLSNPVVQTSQANLPAKHSNVLCSHNPSVTAGPSRGHTNAHLAGSDAGGLELAADDRGVLAVREAATVGVVVCKVPHGIRSCSSRSTDDFSSDGSSTR